MWPAFILVNISSAGVDYLKYQSHSGRDERWVSISTTNHWTCQSRGPFSLTLQFPLVQENIFHFHKQIIFLHAHIIPKQFNSIYGIIFKECAFVFSNNYVLSSCISLYNVKAVSFLKTVHCEINISIRNINDAKPYITKKRENNVSLWSSGSMCGFKIGWLFTKKIFLSRTWW